MQNVANVGCNFSLGNSVTGVTRRLASAAMMSGRRGGAVGRMGGRRAPALTLAVAVLLAGCHAAPAPTAASGGRLDKVRIGVGGLSKIIYAPAKLAERLGYFKDEALDVELVNEEAGQDVEQLMIAGRLEGIVGFMDHAIPLQIKGKCVMSVVQFANVPLERQVVAARRARRISGVADLAGARLGVTAPGSSTDFLTQAIMAKAGVGRTGYATVRAGAGETFIAAIRNGDIDAGMTTAPTYTRLLRDGDAKVLVDLTTVEGTRRALGGLYPGSSLYMPCEWVAAHPRVTQKLANALVRALRFIRARSAAEIAAVMPADYAEGDAPLYVQAWAETKGGFTDDGVIDVEGVRNVLDVLALGLDEVARNKDAVDLTRCYTTEFVSRVPRA